jgi:hypothetical protein
MMAGVLRRGAGSCLLLLVLGDAIFGRTTLAASFAAKAANEQGMVNIRARM